MRLLFCVIYLLGITGCSFSQPNLPPDRTPLQNAGVDFVRQIQLGQVWGKGVLDAARIGLPDGELESLASTGDYIDSSFIWSTNRFNRLLLHSGIINAPLDTRNISEKAWHILKKIGKDNPYPDDYRMALAVGDQLVAITIGVRMNLNYITILMSSADKKVARLNRLIYTSKVHELFIELPVAYENLLSDVFALRLLFHGLFNGLREGARLAKDVANKIPSEGDFEGDEDGKGKVRMPSAVVQDNSKPTAQPAVISNPDDQTSSVVSVKPLRRVRRGFMSKVKAEYERLRRKAKALSESLKGTGWNVDAKGATFISGGSNNTISIGHNFDTRKDSVPSLKFWFEN